MQNLKILYINKFCIIFCRKGLIDGDFFVVLIGNRIILTIGKGLSVLIFDLYECKVVEKRIELQDLLFRLVLLFIKFEGEFVVVNKIIENLKFQIVSVSVGVLVMDFGLKREFRVKFMLKKVGMSVINFGSKKRKVVIGIEFD